MYVLVFYEFLAVSSEADPVEFSPAEKVSFYFLIDEGRVEAG